MELTESDGKPNIKLTDIDREILVAIGAAGFLGFDTWSGFFIETNYQNDGNQDRREVSLYRIDRLEKLGLLTGNNDALIPGNRPQSYSLTKDGEKVCKEARQDI